MGLNTVGTVRAATAAEITSIKPLVFERGKAGERQSFRLIACQIVEREGESPITIYSNSDLAAQAVGYVQCPKHRQDRVFLLNKRGDGISKDLQHLIDNGFTLLCPREAVEAREKIYAENRQAVKNYDDIQKGKMVSVAAAIEEAFRGLR